MEDGKAAGLKSDIELTIRMRNMLGEVADGVTSALKRAEQDAKYDDVGCVRDREMSHAARLATANAQLLRAFMKLRYDVR